MKSLTKTQPPRPLTHRVLVNRIAKWMRFNQSCPVGVCPVVMAELATQCHETPDVLGFYGPGCSILVECKVSRADFLADKEKIFRRYEDQGVGGVRYFAAPKGLLSPDELPEGWGLIEVAEKESRLGDRRVEVRKEATGKRAHKQNEVKILMSAIRRLEISSAVFVQAPEMEAEAGEQWTQEPPTSQGVYWWWNGDPDHAPSVVHVMYSGTTNSYFVGSRDDEFARFVNNPRWKGWWKRIPQEAIPTLNHAGGVA